MDTKTKAVKPAHTSDTPSKISNRPFFQTTGKQDVATDFFQIGAQPKLNIGRRGDTYEREADAVADTVVAGDGATGRAPQISRISGSLQRQPESEASSPIEAEETIQSQAVEEQEEMVQRQPSSSVGAGQSPTASTRLGPLLQRRPARPDDVPAKEDEETLQSQAEDEEEGPVQMQPVEEEETLQAQAEQDEEEETLQTQTLEEEEEQPVQMEAMEEDEEPIQTQEEEEVQAAPANAAQAEAAADVLPAGSVEAQLRESAGAGSPLAEDVRTKMEGQLAAEFNGIRIHTDDISVQLTRLLNAQAFTHGRDIYFNRGRFRPHSRDGEHLLAHELTHTVQQGVASARENEPVGGPAKIQRKEDDPSTYLIRPELLEAIRLARTQIGKVNAQKTNAEGTRIGWERLYEFFFTAFGEKEVIHKDVIKYHKTYKGKDALPSWCGIFVWWSLKKAGIPIADWKLGVSIAGHVVKRKHGELPQKGDIAYMGPDHFDHFAIVSGVESPATAAGKDYKSIQVATVNGNTAGENNLGGQVEEKWHPIGKWLAFFDPIAKLDLPPVELVETGLEPDEPSADEQAADAAGKEAEAEVDTPPTDVAHLDEDVVTEPSLPAEGESDVSVELPEPPAPPPAEEVAKVEELGLEGSSDEAMVGFTEANPSQMAKTQPVLGEKLDTKIRVEKKEEVENAPVLTVQTSGTVEEGLTPPDQIPVPADTQLSDGVKGPDPGKLAAEGHQYKDPTPNNNENTKLLDEKEKEGGFLDWFRNNLKSFMNRIRTKDPTLNTSAGKRPNVKLEGEADPGRMETQRTEAGTQLKAQRDTVTEKLKNHPGQQNIQPKQIEEERKSKLSEEVPVTIETKPDEGAKDYVEAPLSADIRAKSDELLQPDLESHLTEAKTKTQTVAEKRDTDKATEIRNAKDKVAKQNQQADKEQRDIVVANRKKVADQQKAGIEDAYGKVNEFNNDADTKQKDARKQIGDKVKESEEGARKELEKGEKKADGIKKEGEEKAAAEKKKLEKEQEKESWWDKAKNLVKSAVKAVTKAIDGVFNWMREKVAEAINAAKELAVGLINAARDFIKNALNTFRDWAKGMVDKYLKEHFPGLAAAINKGIDTVVDTAIKGVDMVADAAIATVEALADALAKALDDILAAFQTGLKAAVQIAGAVLTGDFAEALRIAIQAGCDIAGIDSKPIFDFIDRAKEAIMNILKDPKGFFNNLVAAVGGGIRNFVKNIKKHLVKGLIGWLTGAISEAGITLPETFDLKGIFSLVMQILGLTYENIKARLIKKYPPAAKVIDLIEKGFEIVKRLVTEGPTAIWDMIKEKLSNLKEMVIGGVRDWVITTVIKEGVIWLLSLLNPAGALAKVLKLLFDFVMFLVERFQQIKDFVLSVYESITAIASGALGKAMAAVEDALSRSVPVVISLLANLIGLGGIGQTIKKIIVKITAPINKGIDFVLDKIIKFAKKLVKGVKGAAKKAKEKVLELIKWWKKKKTFTDEAGGSHKLYFKGGSQSAELWVASSDPKQMEKFFTAKMKEAGEDKEANFKKADVTTAKTYYETAVVPLEKKLEQVDKTYGGGAGGAKLSAEKKAKGVNENKKLVQDLEKVLATLSNQHLKKLFGSSPEDYPPPKLPVMADNKKASSFTADYIVKGEKYKVSTGTESGMHVGNLEGWPALQGAKLTEGSKWVRMHLLPHKLGGNAVDSNLTPASGPRSNIPVSGAVEQPAIKTAVERPPKENKPVWYRFRIGYYSGKASPFPNFLKAEWGHYESKNGKFDRGPTVKTFQQNPPAPEFTPVIPNLNDPNVTAGEISTASSVDRGFVQLLLKVRAENGGSLGTSASSLKTRMETKYVEVDAEGNRRFRFGVENFDNRLGLVLAALGSGKIVLK